MSDKEPRKLLDEINQIVDHPAVDSISELVDSIPSVELIRVVSRLDEDGQQDLFDQLPTEDAAELIDLMPDAQAAEVIHNLEAPVAAEIIEELPSNEQADLIGDLPSQEAEAILAEVQPATAQAIRALAQYPDDVAGGLMVTEFLSYEQELNAGDVVDDLRTHADRYRDFQVQYAFVIDRSQRLVGVLRLRDLLLAAKNQPLDLLMIENPLTIEAAATLDDVRQFFVEHDLLGVPVVDDQQQLLGIVTRANLNEALGERTENDFLKTQGLVKEELRSMPTWTRSRRRLAWLSVNILLNIAAASVIALYQDTLQKVIALAVFLPIISDMSGCSGNQAVAVSMRELSLGLVRPSEVFRTWMKEISVGLINGIALGLLIAMVAVLWKGNPYLGLVVGVAMMANTIIAVSIGGTLPLIMKRLGMDPALASGPILTTITDMCGFLIVLSMATILLQQLT